MDKTREKMLVIPYAIGAPISYTYVSMNLHADFGYLHLRTRCQAACEEWKGVELLLHDSFVGKELPGKTVPVEKSAMTLIKEHPSAKNNWSQPEHFSHA